MTDQSALRDACDAYAAWVRWNCGGTNPRLIGLDTSRLIEHGRLIYCTAKTLELLGPGANYTSDKPDCGTILARWLDALDDQFQPEALAVIRTAAEQGVET